MNTFITAQVDTMITTVKTFQQGCQLAAMKDDGRIDEAEAKTLKRINAASERFIKEIEKIK